MSEDSLNLSVLRKITKIHVDCLYRTKSAFPKAAGRNPWAEQRQQLPRQLSKLRNPTKSLFSAPAEGERAEGRALRGMARQEEWGFLFKSALHALPLRGCTNWDTKPQINMERKFHQPRLMGSP